jgi:hypothetical protein
MSESDDQLAERLRRALDAADPVPPAVLQAARAAFTWRTIDAELAELVADSALAPEAAGLRSAGTARRVTFRARDVEVEVLITEEGAVRLEGQIVPPGPGRVDLDTGEGARTAVADHVGRFAFGEVQPGPLRLRVTTDEGVVISTDWILV